MSNYFSFFLNFFVIFMIFVSDSSQNQKLSIYIFGFSGTKIPTLILCTTHTMLVKAEM